MLKKALTIALVITLLTTFLPIVLTSGPVEPPVLTSTLYVGHAGWGPRRADPVRAYDTGSGELLFNVYDTLIEMGEDVYGYWDVAEQYWAFSPSLSLNVPVRQEVIMMVPDTGINPADPVCYWFEPTSVTPSNMSINPFYHINGWVDNSPDGILGPCDVLYIGEYLTLMEPESIVTKRTWSVLEYVPGQYMVLHHYYYDFIIRTDPVIYFYNSTGDAVDTFDVYDAEYSFERGLVQDQLGSPMWMFYKSLFDAMNSDPWATSPAETYELAYLIEDAIEVVSLDPQILRINMGTAFPDIAFKQIIAQTWGSIVSEQWYMSKGCWNGDLFTDGNADGFPDWWNTTRRLNAPINSIDPTHYCGTGPYRVVTTTSGDPGLVIMQRNVNYWKGWPAPGRISFLEYIDIEYISDWTLRKLAFVACQLDVCDVPRAVMMDLLDQGGEPLYPEIKMIKNVSPNLRLDTILYCFNINPIAAGIWTGEFPDGIPTNFFNNSYVRKAFNYAFDHAKYFHEVWLDGAISRETPGIYGLVPDYYTKGPDPPWTYDYNLDMMKRMLQAAMFTQYGVTKSVWDWGGFRMSIYYLFSYSTPGDSRRLACEMIKAAFDQLNAQYGKNFRILISGLDLGSIWELDYHDLPLYTLGWLADFADADNWYRPYMHSYGYFSYLQDYTRSNGWTTPGPRTGLDKDTLIDLAVKTLDGPERAMMYADLDDIYIADCPNMPIAQLVDQRKWMKYWVKGWYYNALYPSDYYYKLYKYNACWGDVTSATPGIPDGVCHMRDIGYIAAQFGARAPDPARLPPYDLRWAPGSYGCGGYDVYSDRIINMRDIGFACAHFHHITEP